MLLQIFKVEKNYFSIKGLKTKGLKNLAGEESVKESDKKLGMKLDYYHVL